jgi:hypothetical protein
MLGPDGLERNATLQRLVERRVDLAHATGAEPAEDPVVRDALPQTVAWAHMAVPGA